MEQKNEIEEWGLARQPLWFRSALEEQTPGNAQKTTWSGHWLSPKMLQWVLRQFCLQPSPNLRLPSAAAWCVAHPWMTYLPFPSLLNVKYSEFGVHEMICIHALQGLFRAMTLKFPRSPDPWFTANHSFHPMQNGRKGMPLHCDARRFLRESPGLQEV